MLQKDNFRLFVVMRGFSYEDNTLTKSGESQMHFLGKQIREKLKEKINSHNTSIHLGWSGNLWTSSYILKKELRLFGKDKNIPGTIGGLYDVNPHYNDKENAEQLFKIIDNILESKYENIIIFPHKKYIKEIIRHFWHLEGFDLLRYPHQKLNPGEAVCIESFGLSDESIHTKKPVVQYFLQYDVDNIGKEFYPPEDNNDDKLRKDLESLQFHFEKCMFRGERKKAQKFLEEARLLKK